MRLLNAAQIDGDLLFQRDVDRLAEIMPQQHIFGRDRRVGLELENPMAVGTLLRQQRLRAVLDLLLERIEVYARRVRWFCSRWALFDHSVDHDCWDCLAMIPAARLPERIAPSMVAGRPVSVQSPARTRLRRLVTAPGRLASWAGLAAKVARRSRTICHGGSSAGNPVSVASSLQIFFASSSRGASI